MLAVNITLLVVRSYRKLSYQKTSAPLEVDGRTDEMIKKHNSCILGIVCLINIMTDGPTWEEHYNTVNKRGAMREGITKGMNFWPRHDFNCKLSRTIYLCSKDSIDRKVIICISLK